MKKPPIRRLARYQQWVTYTGTSIIGPMFDTRWETRAWIRGRKHLGLGKEIMIPVKVRVTVEEI